MQVHQVNHSNRESVVEVSTYNHRYSTIIYNACMFGMHRLVTRPYSSLVKAFSCLHNYAVQHAMTVVPLMQISVGRTTDTAQFRGGLAN